MVAVLLPLYAMIKRVATEQKHDRSNKRRTTPDDNKNIVSRHASVDTLGVDNPIPVRE